MLIVFWALPNIPNRGFVSTEGKHTPKSLGSDLKLDKSAKRISKNSGIRLSWEDFRALSESLTKTQSVLENGMLFAYGITTGIINNKVNALINNSMQQIPIVSQAMGSSLGENKAKYYCTVAHIGESATSQLTNMNKNYGISYQKKILTDSSLDYTSSTSRKHLRLTTGFNQKGIAFMMEDTFVSLNDYLELFDHQKTIINKLTDQVDVRREFYGAVYKTKNQFKITNRLEYYNVAVKIHLVKIIDYNITVRDLIRQITYTQTTKDILDEREKNKPKKFTKFSKLDQDVASYLPTQLTVQIPKHLYNMVIGELPEPWNTIILNELDKIGRERYNTTDTTDIEETIPIKEIKDIPGKFIRKNQYSAPSFNSLNKFSCQFNVSLSTRLTDSTRFNDRAKIVRTWHKVLSPSSIWEFNLDHHLGKGIHLNRLYDISENLLNKDQKPSAYTFVIEYLGDRRAMLARKESFSINKRKNNPTVSHFQGYSPCRLQIEFKREIGYLYKFDDEYKEKPAHYVIKSGDEDNFEENPDFKELFMPGRQERFNVNYDEIKLFSESPRKPTPYELEYDNNIVGSPNPVVIQLQEEFKKAGIDPNYVTEDDAKYNYTSQKPDPEDIDDRDDLLDLDDTP